MTITKEQYLNEIATHPIRHFNINLTNQCNLRCYYCFAEHNPRNLSWETMKATIDFAINQYFEKGKWEDTLNFTFFGGEPMLRYEDIIIPSVKYVKDIFSKKDIEKKYWPGFSMTTNGTLLNRKSLEFFREHNFSLLLSIDGNEESQNVNRPKADGSGSFQEVKKNIPDLLELFPNTTFRSTLTPKTVDKIMDNYFFAQDMGFNSYFLIPNECEPWNEEQKLMLTYQMGIMGEYFYDCVSQQITPLYFSPLMKAFENLLVPPKFSKSVYRCGLGTASVGISTEGKISGCQEYSSYIENNDLFYIGDVFNGIDIDKHLVLLNSYMAEEHIKPNNSECNPEKCICYDMCNRNTCPSKNYTLYKNMNLTSDIICHWKRVCYYTAENLLEKAAKENNQNFKNYLKFYLPQGRNH